MVAFGNPVQGLIAEKGAAHPAGTFAVTSTFADHVASGRAPGIDIGNGGCGDVVLAMGAGVISLVKLGVVGSTSSVDASIVRIAHANGWISGVAHLKVRAGLAVGQAVPEGYELGLHDKIGATACHVHFGLKDPSGVEVDAWPYLRQNGAVEDEVLQGANPQRIVNRQSSVLAADTNFRSSPFVRADNKLVKFAAGAAFYVDWSVEGTQVGVSNRWYGGWANVAPGKQFGYFHESVLAPLSPIEDGYSDADLNAAKKVAANVVSAAANAAASKF